MESIKTSLLLLILLLPFSWVTAQPDVKKVDPPQVNQFAPILQFLASPELEGREPGARGRILAADYIASMMQRMDLKPYKQTVCREERKLSDYFQTFALPRYTVDVASVSINPVEKDLKQVLLIPGKSFTLENSISDLSLESAMVFAGYGINSRRHP